jgi:hypothetical protein
LLKPCKVKQTSAECKTKNEVFGIAYAECSQTYEKLAQGERKSKLVCDFFRTAPNLSKVKQTSAECKTKNEVFGFAYAECSQTYLKLRKRVPSAVKLV